MEDVFALIVFICAVLPEMFATETLIWLSDTFTKETLVSLNRTLVVFDK